MGFETLLVHRDDPIVTVTFNRPDSRNPLDALAARELIQVLDDTHHDADARVLILKGAGRAFSAGGDIKRFAKAKPIEHLDDIAPIVELAKKFFRVRFPTIASVHGPALGGGAGLVSMCDFAIASENAEIGYPEINLSLLPATVSVLLARMVPRRIAVDLLFRGRRISAGDAVEMGLINKAVTPVQLDFAVAELATELAAKSPLAMRQLKATFYGQADQSFEQALDVAVERFAALSSSRDFHEGLAAFLEKRDPEWTGE